jgi:hypothetical protein
MGMHTTDAILYRGELPRTPRSSLDWLSGTSQTEKSLRGPSVSHLCKVIVKYHGKPQYQPLNLNTAPPARFQLVVPMPDSKEVCHHTTLMSGCL